MFVDRGGVKVALQESYSRNSQGSLGVVLERVRDVPPSSHFPASQHVQWTVL